ncbi:MAG: hypothetical protein AAF773_15090 [Cyanobacteria bacterium P01_D01_bin.115]
MRCCPPDGFVGWAAASQLLAIASNTCICSPKGAGPWSRGEWFAKAIDAVMFIPFLSGINYVTLGGGGDLGGPLTR